MQMLYKIGNLNLKFTKRKEVNIDIDNFFRGILASRIDAWEKISTSIAVAPLASL